MPRPYGRRTNVVRVLSVGTTLPEAQTGRMTTDTQATSFVTGAAGFIGSELVKVLVARHHRVFGLTESVEAAERVRRAGAVPVMGDLLEPGPWQDQAAADWVFHVPPQATSRPRMSGGRAASTTRSRVIMDGHLLDAVAAGATRRIVYVADTVCYGATGPRPITEDAPPRPSVWGRQLAPALSRLEGYIVAGLPIITALPGWVYGDAAWFRERVIDPVMSGRRVLLFGKTCSRLSLIHVEDCARALVHIAEHGEPGGRYFLVNNDPIQMRELAATFARLANRPLRTFRVPAMATRLMAGPDLADQLRADAVFSNIRLRAIGFRFRYPTLEQGLQQVLGVLK
jgi:nucleoside-diphosphate-sugar epimerase